MNKKTIIGIVIFAILIGIIIGGTELRVRQSRPIKRGENGVQTRFEVKGGTKLENGN